MPILYPEDGSTRIRFEGRCSPDEGDALLDWLRQAAKPEAELATCADIHTALLQLLLAARVKLVSPPADPILANCLAAAMGQGTTTAPSLSAKTVRSKPKKRTKHSAE